ncbi:hypothetical protein S40288_07585 [Stachybotrys chartarum IBT 40288]|nr:hypothetical protein S40288_07585 [Stachybotrys chartarum IBT 40288]
MVRLTNSPSDQTVKMENSEDKDALNHDEKAEQKANGGFMRVFTYGRPVDYMLESIAFLAAISSGVALALINLVIGNFINVLSDAGLGEGIPPDFMDRVQTNVLYFVYIGVARLVLTYVYSTLFTWVSFNIVRNIQHDYFRAALSQEVGYFDKDTTHSISTQASMNGRLIQSGISEKLGQCFQAMATLIAAFILAFVIQWRLTLIIVCIFPTIILVFSVAVFFDSKIEAKIGETKAQAGSFAESILGSIKTIQAFNLRPRLVSQYAKLTQNAFDSAKSKGWCYGFMLGGQYFATFAGMGLAFWQGIAMIDRGEIDNFGVVFTVLFSVIIGASSLNALAPNTVAIIQATTAANDLFVLIDRQSEIDSFAETGSQPGIIQGKIDLESVTFAYPARPDLRVLEDFTLRIPAGKVTAIVGPSGSGKSTIIGLLERWYNPTSGSIKLDGVSTETLNLHWLRANIRLVQQEPTLFNETVFENIAYGLVGTQWEICSREEKLELVKQAARMAFADDFINKLPNGYDTRIGERGGLLSGGQKQRIAIARSIVSQPQILLLDEATSALDSHAEKIVRKALDRASKGRTTVVIAHKLKTIRDADNIVVISRGKVMEQGTHDELMHAGMIYPHLVKQQDLSTVDSHDESDQELKGEASPANELDPRGTWGTTIAKQPAHTKDQGNLSSNEEIGMIRSVAKLVAYSWELRHWYSSCVLACAVGAASYPGQALLLANLLSLIGSPDLVPRGNFLALMFFVIAIGCLFAYFVIGYSTNVISQVPETVPTPEAYAYDLKSLNRRLRNEILDRILRQDLSFFDRADNTVGALTNRLSSYPESIQELMGFTIALIVAAAINVIASGILSIVVSWRLGLVGTFAGLPPMVLAGYIRTRVQDKMDSEIDKKFSQSSSVASETINAMRTVSSLGIEAMALDKYTKKLDDAISGSKAPLFHTMVYFSLTQCIEYFILALGFWWGSRLLSQGQLTFYQFIVSFLGVYFSGQAAAQLFSFTSSLTKAKHAANYYFWLSALQPVIRSTADSPGHEQNVAFSSYNFKGVEFSYPLAPNNQVLNGISLKILPGQFVAFVGASGCGKSTMISLLERFYDPIGGQILIDNKHDLETLDPWLYRSRIALVQQEPVLYPTTIRANVLMGIDFDLRGQANRSSDHISDADDQAVERALRAANAWDFVISLPQGLNTPCGTSGSLLSGGQRQRIAIARALIRNPGVLLLDEATSALDTDSERVVQAALLEAARAEKRITIAVAHRLSTVREADCIFVVVDGRIVESGSHTELIGRGGIYGKMCQAQSLSTIES